MVTAGVILAEAALLDGKNVAQTQSYGPEARLGASKAEVIISTQRIAYPQVTNPDILLCLSQDAYERYFPHVRPGTRVILDSSTIERKEPLTPEPTPSSPDTDPQVYWLPITETAIRLGNKQVANVVGLGALNKLARLVSPENLRKAVLKRVPERFRTLNEQALEAGEQLVADLASPLEKIG